LTIGLESEGLIKAEWKPSDNNRRARYYKLTRKGCKRLRQIEVEWRVHTAVIESFLAFEE
jgi:PadR family transcriptional regulator, regulatory protein PadR